MRRFSFLLLLLLPWRRTQAQPTVRLAGWRYNQVLQPASPLVYYLAFPPVSGSTCVYLGGLRLTPGMDYTQNGARIELVPHYRDSTNTQILVDYMTP